MDIMIPEFIKEETRKRCKIVAYDEPTAKKTMLVSPELFHFFFEAKKVNFNLYVRIENVLVEFMRAEEFSHQLLDQIKSALLSDHRVEIMVLRSQKMLFEQMIEQTRAAKIQSLVEKDPLLDRKALNVFSNLSNASQLVVRGGITDDVVNQVKSSANFMVNNLIESDVAIATLSRMVTHDPTLYDHSASVAMISGLIAMQCLDKPLSKKVCELVAQCGLYHDVGKTCIPSSILNKPGKFTDSEFVIMKTHAELGERELEQLIKSGKGVDPLVARVAGEHHERFNGKGYPRGRSGKLEDDHTKVSIFTHGLLPSLTYTQLYL